MDLLQCVILGKKWKVSDFGKEGYWSDVLKDDLKYHISALFVVDLQKFRSIKAGDRLRALSKAFQ